MTDAAELAAHAHGSHVVVIGGGMAGLVAALQCAKVGVRVTLLEGADRVGGVLRPADVGGIVVDGGAESFATRGGHVRALVDEVGLSDAVVRPAAGGAWVAGLPGGKAAPLPKGGVLGIPANPFSDDVRRVIGWPGAWRAYLDRVRPPLTIGHQRSLGALVRSRLGARVLDRLVAPVTSGVYSAHPDDIDVELAAPGLSTALTRVGSLQGAVEVLRGDRASAPGSAVEGIDGGMWRLADALADHLRDLGADIRTGMPVEAIARADDGRWTVAVADRAEAEEPASTPLLADAVIVATSEQEARRLLAPHAPGLAAAGGPAPVVEIVTLVLDSPALDPAPRGTGVLTVPGSHRAKALTHSSAKWEWVAREAHGRHVVRVSFGSQGEAPATAALSDADAVALALAEAAALLGIPLRSESLVASHRDVFVQAQPGSAIGQVENAAAARAAVEAVPGLGAAGAWLAGTGLAQVVPDAAAEGDRIRHALLWKAG